MSEETETEIEAGDAPGTCPECGASNPPDAKFCESCGVTLATKRRKGTGKAARRTSDRDRRSAEKQLGVKHLMTSARSTIANARVYLSVLGAVMALLGLLVDEPLAKGILLGLAGAFLIGAWLLPKAPLPGFVAMAGLMTVFIALILIGGGFPAWWMWLMAISLWAAVPRIARASRVVRENRDVLGDDAFTSTTTRLKRERRERGEGPSQARTRARERRVAESAGRGRSMAIIAAGIVVGIAVVVAVVQMAAAGETIDVRATELREHWNADRHDHVAAMMLPDRRREFWPKIERVLNREGWDEDLPRIGEPKFVERHDQRAIVVFAIEGRTGASVKTYWNLENTLWKLYSIHFTGLRD